MEEESFYLDKLFEEKLVLTQDDNYLEENIKYFFNKSIRSLNNNINIIRENIIYYLINNKININKFNNNIKIISISLLNFLNKLFNIKNKNFNEFNIIKTAGRTNNFDFIISYNKICYNIEFKFNVNNITKLPQFLQLSNIKNYIENKVSFEIFYFNNYFNNIIKIYNNLNNKKFNIDLNKFLKEIIKNNSIILNEINEYYYIGCKNSFKYDKNNKKAVEFYNFIKEINNKCIKEFIINNEINIELILNKIKKTNNNKIFMLFDLKQKNFILENLNFNDGLNNKKFNVEKFDNYYLLKIDKFNFKILLRFKNGLLNPCFQISFK